MKMVFLTNHTNDSNPENADNLMKVLMIERMCKSIMDELENLKKSLIRPKVVEVEVEQVQNFFISIFKNDLSFKSSAYHLLR